MADLNRARQQSELASRQAITSAQSTKLIPDRLKETLMKKINYNQDIIGQQAKAQADYFAAGDVGREKYSGIIDPRKREALVNQYKAQQFEPYRALTGVAETRQGTIADIIGAGSRAAEASNIGIQGGAEIARTRYQDLLGEYQFGERMSREDQRIALQRAQLERSSQPKESTISVSESLALAERGFDYPPGTSTNAVMIDMAGQDIPEYDVPRPEQIDPYSESGIASSAANLERDLRGGAFQSRGEAESALIDAGYSPQGEVFESLLDEYFKTGFLGIGAGKLKRKYK